MNFKKICCFLVSLLLLTGCSEWNEIEYEEIDPQYINYDPVSDGNSVENTHNLNEEKELPNEETVVNDTDGDEETEAVDLDLSNFSSNMLYAEINNMMLTPEEYNGKTIKLAGEFLDVPKDYDENGQPISDERSYYCIISDAMACCSVGIELLLINEINDREEYIGSGSKIEVTGTCKIFNEKSSLITHIQLVDAKINKIK